MRTDRAVVLSLSLALLGLVAILSRPRREPAAERTPPDPPLVTRAPGPRLPAPRMRVATPPAEPEPEAAPATDLLARLERLPPIEPEQLAGYIEANHRSAESLLAAFDVTRDHSFLREALQRYPNDPQVNLRAYFLLEPYNNKEPATPARRAFLDAFRAAAPENALADYLSAHDHLKAGRTDQAVQDLLAASSKPKLDDYSLQFVQSTGEALRAAGRSEAEAALESMGLLLVPHLSELRQLGGGLVELAKQYRQAGDAEYAIAALEIGVTLGQQMSEPSPQNTLIENLVGNAIQRQALGAFDAGAAVGQSGRPAQEWIDELSRQRDEMKECGQQTGRLLHAMSEQDLISYFERVKLFGEREAVRWALAKYPKP